MIRADHQERAGVGALGDDPVGVLDRGGEGLLAEDGAATGREARADVRGVLVGRAADRDDLDLGVGQQIVDPGRGARTEAFSDRGGAPAAAVADVHESEVAGGPRQRGGVQRRDAGPRPDDAHTPGHVAPSRHFSPKETEVRDE